MSIWCCLPPGFLKKSTMQRKKYRKKITAARNTEQKEIKDGRKIFLMMTTSAFLFAVSCINPFNMQHCKNGE